MNNLQRAMIVITTAIAVKYLLEYLNPLGFKNKVPNIDSKHEQAMEKKTIVFARDFLEKSKGGSKIYLGFLGNVYDVSKGTRFYAPGGSYEFFAAKDATRAFATGDFVNDLNDQIEDLRDEQVNELFKWKDTYDKDYIWVGLIEGAFYDKNGEKTHSLLEAEKKRGKHKLAEQKNVKFNQRFPPCNTEWKGATNQNRFWCTTKSGGIQRDWAGYPRIVFNSFHNSDTCACVLEKDFDHPSVKQYEGCATKSHECFRKNKPVR